MQTNVNHEKSKALDLKITPNILISEASLLGIYMLRPGLQYCQTAIQWQGYFAAMGGSLWPHTAQLGRYMDLSPAACGTRKSMNTHSFARISPQAFCIARCTDRLCPRQALELLVQPPGNRLVPKRLLRQTMWNACSAWGPLKDLRVMNPVLLRHSPRLC